MPNDVAVTFRVEEGVRDAFSRVAESQGRSVSELLREHMRRAIDAAEGAQPLVSEQERARRQANVDVGFANVELEGLHISEATKARAKLYVDGFLSMDEFVQLNLAELKRGD